MATKLDTLTIWNEIFKYIHPSWSAFFNNDAIKKTFWQGLNYTVTVINLLNEKKPGSVQLCPLKEYLLMPFVLCDKTFLKILILGQDPYQDLVDACGVAFSNNNPSIDTRGKINPSLQAIFGSMFKFGHMSNDDGKEEVDANETLGIDDLSLVSTPTDNTKKKGAAHSCLFNWVSQGVLLYNATPVFILGNKEKAIINKIKAEWQPFTNAFIRQLSAEHPNLVYVLWGGDARKKRSEIKDHTTKSHLIYEYHHPSPLADTRVSEDKKFENVDHFTTINSMLASVKAPKINWNITQTTIIYVDGACAGNHIVVKKSGAAPQITYDVNGGAIEPQKTRKSGYGIIVANGPLKGMIYYQNTTNILTNPIHETTNNRSEMYGIIEVLKLCIRQQFIGPLIIKCDSEYAVNMLTSYIKKWDDTTIEGKKNPDLVKIMKFYAETVEKLYMKYGGYQCFQIARNSDKYATLADTYSKNALLLDHENIMQARFTDE
jgi:uracil-DNA glycosylase